MTAPVFTRASASVPLFTLAQQLTAVPAYTVAFLPAGATGETSLTLAQTWTATPGIYLMLGKAPADPDALATRVREYAGTAPVRFLYLQNPDDVPAAWRASQVQVTVSEAGAGTVAVAARVGFGGYTLGIGQGCAVALNAEADGFGVTPPGAGGVYLEAGGGAVVLAAAGALALPFGGEAAGSLRVDVPVPRADWPALDAGCRWFADDPDNPGYLRSLACPVAVPPPAGLVLHSTLDPVNPLVPARTLLRFLGPGGTGGVAMDSGYRTVLGQPVQLTPVAGPDFPDGPGLAFQVRATTPAGGEGDPFYLTFHGPFAPTVPSAASTAAPRLMCGTSGVEYAGVAPGGGHRMLFCAGQPAYATPAATGAAAGGAATPPLTGEAATAWCALVPAAAGAATYYAQPRESVFYEPPASSAPPVVGGGAPGGGDGVHLSYLEVPAGVFPAAAVLPGGDGTPTLFPWSPYALAAPEDAQALRRLEQETISPARRGALSGFLLPTGTGSPEGTRTGTTPQGLVVTFDQTLGTWRTVTLARNQGGAEQLRLADVTGGLKAALQSDQLFTVVSRADVFEASCSVVGAFALTLGGWTFRLGPAGWGAHRTLVVFKGATRTLQALADDLSAWGWTEAAAGWSASSGTLRDVQRSLQSFLADARARGAADPDLAAFVRDVVDNPAWNGVLFLRADLSGALPPELAGLAAGIDPEGFMAHHVGVTLTPVQLSGGALVPHDSSIFALVAYDDPQDLFYQDRDYAYKVLSLKVRFANSAVASFSSRIELMINALFGDPCILRGSGHGNNLILEGAYQQQGGQAHYTFVQQGVSRFVMTSATLQAVETLTAQLVTLIPPAGDAGDVVRTEFRLTGDLQFRTVDGFDLFSFGPPPGTDAPGAGGLRFSGLVVRMSFPAAAPGEQSFAFDAGTMSFDAASSVARADSVYAGLPLKLAGLVQSPGGVSPGDLGYMSVAAPVDQAALAPPWYALAFQLQLGTLGALAGNAGLVATLSACWAPSQDRPKVYLGLKLPGSSSARPEIPLAGVLSLSFGTIELVVDDSGPAAAYLLLLRGIALRLLGISFPPGQTDLYVFGDPTQPRGGSFGWYAAYAADDEDGGGGAGGGGARPGPLRAAPVPALPAVSAAGDPGCGCE